MLRQTTTAGLVTHPITDRRYAIVAHRSDALPGGWYADVIPLDADGRAMPDRQVRTHVVRSRADAVRAALATVETDASLDMN